MTAPHPSWGRFVSEYRPADLEYAPGPLVSRWEVARSSPDSGLLAPLGGAGVSGRGVCRLGVSGAENGAERLNEGEDYR